MAKKERAGTAQAAERQRERAKNTAAEARAKSAAREARYTSAKTRGMQQKAQAKRG
ncbi:hypothetical protein SUDANB120_03420 [Streptomyces sp. enrichment culture]|uniref:hypothetical protein n=1 Tax=Streptomyces TaxID=1883 RepID=UPI0016758E31|nr:MULTISPECIES: hypothetical protein [Streptomyces]MBD3575079.1 hypothetical protein [Streptomyces sp. KD18]GGT16910.1 hypothetical protein GCM10010286_48170 [Streptomyces toxytricini]